MSLYYKEPLQINMKKINNLLEKWTKDIDIEKKYKCFLNTWKDAFIN